MSFFSTRSAALRSCFSLVFICSGLPTDSLIFLLPPEGFRTEPSSAVAQLLSHVALIHNLHPATLFGINPSFWSIAAEVQLYLLYPALLLLARRFGWKRTLAGLIVLEPVFRFVPGFLRLTTGIVTPMALSNLPFKFCFSWSIGSFIADRWFRGESIPFRHIPTVVPVAAGIAAGWSRWTEPLSFPFFALATAAFVASRLGRTRGAQSVVSDQRVCARHLEAPGVISYSFYLVHQPLLEHAKNLVLSMVTPSPGPMLVGGACLVCYPLLFGLSWMLYHAAEMPAVRLGKWVLGVRRRDRIAARAIAVCVESEASGKSDGSAAAGHANIP